MMKAVRCLITVALIFSLLTSCASIRAPLKNENVIPGTDITIKVNVHRHSLKEGNPIFLYFDFYTDAYEELSIRIDGGGFDYYYDANKHLENGQTVNFKSDTLTHSISIADVSDHYESILDGETVSEYDRCSVVFHAKRQESAPNEGYISLTISVKDKVTQKEHEARYYVYYATNNRDIAFSSVSIHAATKALEAIIVVY